MPEADTLFVSRPACTSVHHGDAGGCAYRIAWSINPHMKVGSVDPTHASEQHARFVDTLHRSRAQVVRMPFVHGAYDSVFLKDSAILVQHDGKLEALIATPMYDVRATEQSLRAAQLQRLGFQIADALPGPLEGGDVVVPAVGNFALMGHGFRSARDSVSGLSRFLRREVIPLELCDPTLYHLDTAIAVLSNNIAVVCAEAFTASARQAIAKLPFHGVHFVTPAEARRFALNVVEIGDVVVTGTASNDMAVLWKSLGRRQVLTNIDEFQLAGGSAACLVSRVHAVA